MSQTNGKIVPLSEIEISNRSDTIDKISMIIKLPHPTPPPEGYKKFQTVGLTGYHLLHLSTIDIEKGSKINLVLACKCVRAMLLDEKFRILGDVDVRVQSCTALIFTFTSQ